MPDGLTDYFPITEDVDYEYKMRRQDGKDRAAARLPEKGTSGAFTAKGMREAFLPGIGAMRRVNPGVQKKERKRARETVPGRFFLLIKLIMGERAKASGRVPEARVPVDAGFFRRILETRLEFVDGNFAGRALVLPGGTGRYRRDKG